MAIDSHTTPPHRNWTHDSVGLAAAVLKMLEQLEAETQGERDDLAAGRLHRDLSAFHRGLGTALREAYARQAEAAQAV